ncbi:fluoride efflux transporter CrcB [Kitasatospora sp. NBC_01287]|uniref:fluoride efflux transporter CrcB n=1 Tax=Kitasatospora sp. NBC_01287 TaxID=2903573 RepID=UPI002255D7EE|nr:fluoride efflux transporter CrcB [Kitasatospora sp. NBC_01287]MCX4747699.1 fluoride efflux transporter CrcB [Kitasatospora sp. NBC_01287]
MSGRTFALDAVAVVAVGGVLGAEARYEAGRLWPTVPGTFPWTTLLINVLGCLVIGVFLVAITEGRPAHRLVRPFFGTGVLGGFTTFSTYCVDIQRLLTRGEAGTAIGYLALTLAAAMVAVAGGAGVARWALARGGRLW